MRTKPLNQQYGRGVPTFRQTLDAMLSERVVESYLLAEDIHTHNPVLLAYLQEKLAGLPCEFIPHVERKQRSAQVRFAIRTGKFIPYPNIILTAGVAFPV